MSLLRCRPSVWVSRVSGNGGLVAALDDRQAAHDHLVGGRHVLHGLRVHDFLGVVIDAAREAGLVELHLHGQRGSVAARREGSVPSAPGLAATSALAPAGSGSGGRHRHELGLQQMVEDLKRSQLVRVPGEPADLVQAAPAVHQEEDLPLLLRERDALLHALGVRQGLDDHVEIREDVGQAAALVQSPHALHDQVLEIHLQRDGGGRRRHLVVEDEDAVAPLEGVEDHLRDLDFQEHASSSSVRIFCASRTWPRRKPAALLLERLLEHRRRDLAHAHQHAAQSQGLAGGGREDGPAVAGEELGLLASRSRTRTPVRRPMLRKVRRSGTSKRSRFPSRIFSIGQAGRL